MGLAEIPSLPIESLVLEFSECVPHPVLLLLFLHAVCGYACATTSLDPVEEYAREEERTTRVCVVSR